MMDERPTVSKSPMAAPSGETVVVKRELAASGSRTRATPLPKKLEALVILVFDVVKV